MKVELQERVEQYASALQGYLEGEGEAALQEAYEQGRRALADGLGVLEMAALHHQALVKLLAPIMKPGEYEHTLRTAERFFTESLTPFEMTHRGFAETNVALRASEERYRELFENANDTVFTTDLEGCFTSVNRAGEQLTGYGREETAGIRIDQMVAPEYLPLVQHMLQKKMGDEGATTYEVEIVTKDGHRVPVEVSTRLISQDGTPVGVQGIARDITERRRAQEALRMLNEKLEEEARRIAHALHDEAGQLLVSVHIALEEMARELPPPSRVKLQSLRGLLEQIEQQLRRLSHELRPTILDDLGLVPAIEFLAQGVSSRSGLAILVEGATGGRLPSSVETALYRIVQEALTNIARHAQARQVKIEVHGENQTIRCVVRDDGLGFDVAQVMAKRGGRGLGLIGIKERLGRLSGSLKIHSQPGGGTEMVVTVPLGVRNADTHSSR